MPNSFKHSFEEILLEPFGLVKIDKKVVDLVVALCDIGWLTGQSCQNNVGRVWVSFYQANHASEFLALIAKESKKLRPFVIRATTEGYDKHPRRVKLKNRWWVDAYVDSFFAHKWTATSRIDIRISVRFPKSHLKEVTKIVMEERDRRLSDVK